MIGFNRSPQENTRRAVYSPGTGRKLGYFANDANGRQTAQDLDGRTVLRILRWKDGRNPYTDSHACGGSWVPPSDSR